MGTGYPPFPADQGVCGIERRKLPQRGSGQSPGKQEAQLSPRDRAMRRVN